MIKNIVLDYSVIIRRGDQFFRAKSAEFFMDEHGIQWVKFVPRNGPDVDREVCMRTENIQVVQAQRTVRDVVQEAMGA